MNERSLTLATGAAVLLDGHAARIVDFDHRKVMVVCADGQYRSIALPEFIERARGLGAPPVQGEDPALVLKQLTKQEREQLTERAAHVREVLTGYRSGFAQGAVDGEPRPAYSPGVSMGSRCRAKAEELAISERTVNRWLAAYRDSGEAGLADLRHRRRRGERVDPRWVAAVRAELEASVTASTPTRSAVFLRVRQRLDAAYGRGVVPSPSKASAYRRLAEMAKGTNAVSGSAKGRRSIADQPKGVFGRLRPTRPGEYLILDTQDLDVFVMEPVTCRWLGAQLTVAQDLFDRRIVGMKVTLVSTKAVDVAGVLFEAVTGRSSGRPSLGPAVGLPDHLVFSEEPIDDRRVWCPPECLVVDHGKAFLSAHVIGVCARLGISIQPAQPRKPTDKPTVERFFRTLREGLIQYLPAYKGPDVYSRGENIEDQAFLFVHELEDLIRDWVVSVYHRRVHSGLVVAEWPDLKMSPNDMYALGIAKSGMMRMPADPTLAYEFLRVEPRGIHHDGVRINGRNYSGAALVGLVNSRSNYVEFNGRWPFRVNDDDVRRIYFQRPDDPEWYPLEWEHAPMLNTPLSDEAARYARILAGRSDRFVDPDAALRDLLARWQSGDVLDRRERRLAARLADERKGLAAAAELGLANEQASSPIAPDLGLFGDDDDESELSDAYEALPDGDDMDGEDAAKFYSDALEVWD